MLIGPSARRDLAVGLFTVIMPCMLVAQVSGSGLVAPRLDEAAVLRIAHMDERGTKSELEIPQARVDTMGVWHAVQVRVGHTNRGFCGKVNGCTVLRQRTVLVDDRTGRVLHRSKQKSLVPNYE